jgi:predicted RNA-binding protein with RPS1 domain
MVLEGIVTNVAAFGAFVDVGVHQDGLVHISAMANAYVRDPRKVAKPGDVVRVKVLEVDPKRRRISLTMRLAPRAPERKATNPTIARSVLPIGQGCRVIHPGKSTASMTVDTAEPSVPRKAPGVVLVSVLRIGSQQTRRWREMDSNLRFRARCKSGQGDNRRLRLQASVGRLSAAAVGGRH